MGLLKKIRVISAIRGSIHRTHGLLNLKSET